jgi:hypothetical protein
MITEGPTDLMRQPAGRRRQVSSDESDSDVDDEWEYTMVKTPPTSLSTAIKKFWQSNGKRFRDDGNIFRILGICSSSNSDQWFFRYVVDSRRVDPDDAENWEHTPCREMLRAKWCDWLEESENEEEEEELEDQIKPRRVEQRVLRSRK